MSKMNLPNRLTLIRIMMTPIYAVFMAYPLFGSGEVRENICKLIAGIIFGIAAYTDFLDGNIARKRGIVTNFGIFLDPLADKFLIFTAHIALIFSDYIIPHGTLFYHIFFWCSLIIIFRELAITSMRLVTVNASGVVVAANWLGKVKTVTQIVCIVTVILESILLPDLFGGIRIFGILTVVTATVMTVWSGINYLIAYWDCLKQ